MMSDELLGDKIDQIIIDDIEYSKLPDYIRSLTGNPDLTIDSEGIYTRTWTSERIAAEQPKEAIKVRDMKIVLHTTDGKATEMDWGASSLQYSHDPVWKTRHLSALWPTTEYTLSAKMEWTAAGREWADGLIYGLKQDERQRIGRLLLDYVDSLTINKPQGSRRAARRRLSKRRQQR